MDAKLIGAGLAITALTSIVKYRLKFSRISSRALVEGLLLA